MLFACTFATVAAKTQQGQALADRIAGKRPRTRGFLIQVPAEFLVDASVKPIAGALVDLSSAGAFAILYCYVEFTGRAGVQFVCGEHKCEARGHVVRYVPLAQALGIRIEFDECDEALSTMLRDWSNTPFTQSDRLARIRDVRITLK